jgi:hypothetical protein
LPVPEPFNTKEIVVADTFNSLAISCMECFFLMASLFIVRQKLFLVNRFTFFSFEPGKSVYLPKVYPPLAKHGGGHADKKGGKPVIFEVFL